ncbi:MAG: glucose-6-phosphate isomerase [Gammaproteobacteria bacterium]|nr:glucose-6-phosphate isomerase [Gammaproteobacteria bacterium]
MTSCTAWRELGEYRRSFGAVHMRELFAADLQRASRFSSTFEGLFLDYSKNRIDDDGLALLLQLALERDIPGAIAKSFTGNRLNVTEQRAVLHTALRAPATERVILDGTDVVPAVHQVLGRLAVFSQKVRDGSWLGFSGLPIRDVVNIGIGGSHLGPQMVTTALRDFADGPAVHFVSNIDGADIHSRLQTLNPASTLFIVASKSFGTQETMTNAATARSWLLDGGATAADVERHFVAVSTNAEKVAAFGIDTENMFGFWDWVGGRYSLWSAIGLPIILSVGFERFEQLLAGAHAMDRHFRDSELHENWPVLMALLGVWYNNFLGAETCAVLPYAEQLRWLPEYLQQADMESNGKHTTVDGDLIDYHTGPVVWGSPGTNSQHAYFQLLHQGSRLVPADFIAVVNPGHPLREHHDLLLANCFAQSEALMLGRSLEETRQHSSAELAPHRTFAGNRPSNTILLQQLDPRALGSLVALYEHKIFVQGIIWGINSFDQWGVELGKQLAGEILPGLNQPLGSSRNPSTLQLLDYCRNKSRKNNN